MAKDIRKELNRYYKKKFTWTDLCVYCGQKAYELDHVYPVSLLHQLDINRHTLKALKFCLYIVPSCSECNRTASNKPFLRIKDKRRFIQSQLKKKYKKKMRIVVWEEEELAELGPGMRREVKKAMKNKDILESRISWPSVKEKEYGPKS